MQPAEASEQSSHNLQAMLIAAQNALRLALALNPGIDPMAYNQVNHTLENLEIWIERGSAKTATVRIIPNEEVIVPANVDELSDEEYEVYAELADYYAN